jgi:hypothetical protein
MGVAEALQHVASSLECSGDSPTTPSRRTRAIKAVTIDASLSQTERIKAVRLFRKEIASADAYLAIDDEELRTLYIRDELAEF